MLRFEFLLWIVLIGSVVCEWHETVILVTTDDCVKSIVTLTESYDVLMNSSDSSMTKNLKEKLAPVVQEAKNQLTELLPLAREQRSFDAFPHEIRILSSVPVYCPRELSLTVAEIYYNAKQKIAGWELREILSTEPLGNLEPQTTTSPQGPGEHQQPLITQVIRPADSIRKKCYRYSKINEKMMKSLARIDFKIEAIGAEVREIVRALAEQVPDDEIAITPTPILNDYPLATQVAIATAEHRLSTDNYYKTNLVKNLTIYEGPDVRSNVVILMQKIMSNSVAANYSLYGGHGKEPFDELGLYNVISIGIVGMQRKLIIKRRGSVGQSA